MAILTCLLQASAILSGVSVADPMNAEVMAQDRAWLSSYNTNDLRLFDEIWADNAVLVATDGRIKTKAEERDDVAAAEPPQLKAAWTIENQQMLQLGTTVVIIGDFVQRGTFDGESFERAYRYTNTYAGGERGWRLLASVFTKATPKGTAPRN